MGTKKTLDVQTENGVTFIVWPNDGSHRNNGTANNSQPGQAAYAFTIAETADVRFFVRAHFPTPEDDSFHYRLDGHSNWQTRNGTTSSSFRWINVTSFSTVAPGHYILRILRREDGSKIDKIFISVDSTTPADNDL